MTGADIPQTPPPPRRRRGTPLDMVRSLGLVAVIVLVVVLFNSANQPTRPPVTVDIAATVAAARSATDYPVLAMTRLPQAWYANFAEFAPNPGGHAFHIGYVTDDEQFFAVDAAETLPVASTSPSGDVTPLRHETVAGFRFAAFPTEDGERWVHAATEAEPFDISLTGSGSAAQWREFTRALSATGATAS